MDIVAFISQKGGSGKTTLALHIAVAAEQAGQATVVVDLDPQASASAWGDSREAETPAVVASPASRLEAVLGAARAGGADLAIIDTSPASESSTLVAARAADLLLIPCRPAILDLRAIGNGIDIAKLAGKPCAVILNAVPPRASIYEDAVRAVEGYGVEVAPVHIGQRAAFAQSLALGETASEYDQRGKASSETQILYTWIRKKLRKTTHDKG